MASKTSTRPDVDLLESVLLDENAEPTQVPLSLLEGITNCFSDENEIGKGGFAVVYKGVVGNGTVAVKKLATLSLLEDKFEKELKCLIMARHKNIVRFVGYCSDTQKRVAHDDGKVVVAEIRNWLLCFEYVPNGSLEKYITDASRGLEWRERYVIIKGICEGLLHLHERHILHLDLKPANILVDDHMIPKITDFGLSRCLEKEQTRDFTLNVCGSMGYFPPELLFRGEVAYASDIYSLGVIILEILTGKKGYPQDDNVIDNWKNRLEGSDHWDVQLEQVRVCMKIGIKCMDLDPKKRPVARHIIDTLDGRMSSVDTSISSPSVEQFKGKNYQEQMVSGTTATYDVDQLGCVLLNENPDAINVPLSLLEEITNCFSDEHQIGSGGLAVVYKGIVGKWMIAVKKLSRTFDFPESKFHNVVECLLKAKHKNIVRFLGYCAETQGRIEDYDGKFVMSDIRNWLLCFEYVPNGSLDKHITDASCGLEWRVRFEIIKGICEGLLHLHKMRILHLDLKPGNILIDDRMVPKIADFGLSRCLDRDETQVFTSNLCGSQGYLAPEFFIGQVAFASDIYSLGCIILEILTGRKGYPEYENVVDSWMNRLEGSDNWDVQLEQVRVCMKIGIECMDLDPKKRPVAAHIINKLVGTTSSVETSIGSSVEQYYEARTIKLASEFVEYVSRHREDHWQQGQEKALGDAHQNALEDPSISSSNSGVLYKLSNLNFFNTKARRNYVINGGPVLEKIKCVKLFKKDKLRQILNERNLIGEGWFGKFYVGFVDRVPVVVRKLAGVTMRENGQFANEVIIQSQILHKNIARLMGCCLEVDIPMLVYQWYPEGSLKWHPKGSLHDILHGNNKVPLDLGMRLSIAAESAGGLAYMHSRRSKILHGNVEPASILLDDFFVPKMSDFGISRMIDNSSQHTGRMIGGMAYMDPVYVKSGVMTEKSDVYSFGVVILELLTRKKATHADGNSLLRNFFENHNRRMKSTELFDEEIAVAGDMEILDNLAEIALECLNPGDPDRRPTMTDIAERLSKLNHSRRLTHRQAS